MPLDLPLFAGKLVKYRAQFQEALEEMSAATGIPVERLRSLESGTGTPNGDEVLIIADHFHCDYKFFISNERTAAFEQTETMFRRWGDQLSPADRWAIQEFLYLCECEEYLWTQLGHPRREFRFTKHGTHFKTHGRDAAAELRRFLGYSPITLRPNAYSDFRSVGLHIFRRRLDNPEISGLFVRHPTAGRCILINYVEDIYRQHFTVAHEAGHALLDDSEDVVLSFSAWKPGDLSEIRANAFASNYLMPPEFLSSISGGKQWNVTDAKEWAMRLRVSTHALAYALKGAKLVSSDSAQRIRNNRIPREDKQDPELVSSLSEGTRNRWEQLLQQGLSPSYVQLCFRAYSTGVISAGRLSEMLRVLPEEVVILASLAGVPLAYGD